MANLYIEPYLFACPCIDDTADSFYDYVSGLLEWQKLKSCSWANVYILSDTADILIQEGKYPLWPDLKKIIEKYNIKDVQHRDIITLVDSFLQKFQKINEKLFINDLLLEDIITDPDINSLNRTDVFSYKLTELLAFMKLCSVVENRPDSYQILLTELKNCSNISITSTISILESDIDYNFTLPLSLNSSFSCCNNYSNLFRCINTSLLWFYANNEIERLKMAIIIHSFNKALALCKSLEVISVDIFSFGPDFMKNIVELHFDNNLPKIQSLLDSISDILLDQNLRTTHWIRTGKGANDPQITRNEYKAWRKDIDYDFHLHYWKSNSKIEIANIVPHNVFTITE